PLRRFTYRDFICLNERSALGGGDQPGGDVTFWFLADIGQIVDAQPDFYAGVEYQAGYIQGKLAVPIEGEIIMFGRSADCGDEHLAGSRGGGGRGASESSPAVVPGVGREGRGKCGFVKGQADTGRCARGRG